MTKEELINKEFTQALAMLSQASGFKIESIQALIEMAWDYGYSFAAAEQELNKGASF